MSTYALNSEDYLSDHFASTLRCSNRKLERRSRHLPSLTRDSLTSLELSLNNLRLPQIFPFLASHSTESLSCSPLRSKLNQRPAAVAISDPSSASAPSRPSLPPMTRRYSWADARSSRREERWRSGSDSSSGSSGEDSEGESSIKINAFPPRRPSLRPLHRRVRSDPGPNSSTSTNKRDLRRSLLKRRATLTQSSSQRPTVSLGALPPPPARPPRSRRSIDTAQALRLKTFNFPSTSTSPFLSASSNSSSSGPSSNSSFSSANSVGSRFSDDSSSDSSGSETDDSEDEEDREGRKNAFDLELDLFPCPPSPASSASI
ncbi:hypothetical protein JCM16303_007365 [Sporobolomyces ruberrimus]